MIPQTDTDTITLQLCPNCQSRRSQFFTTRIDGKLKYGIICLRCGWITKTYETTQIAALHWNDGDR